MYVLDQWESASSCDFNLSDQVHIWKISLTITDTQASYLFKILDKTEQQRAGRFHFKKDRKSYISARGYTRLLLGKYFDRSPAEFTFSYNNYGKPFLAELPVEFNISHSRALGLLAFDAEKSIGVDIEWMRPDFGGLKIARRFFSEEEVRELESLSEADQKQGFFNGWSRKEAYIKAVGKGLAIPLGKFSVSLSPYKECVLRSTNYDPEAIYTYKLLRVDSDPDYTSAVVVHQIRERFKLFSIKLDKINSWV